MPKRQGKGWLLKGKGLLLHFKLDGKTTGLLVTRIPQIEPQTVCIEPQTVCIDLTDSPANGPANALTEVPPVLNLLDGDEPPPGSSDNVGSPVTAPRPSQLSYSTTATDSSSASTDNLQRSPADANQPNSDTQEDRGDAEDEDKEYPEEEEEYPEEEEEENDTENEGDCDEKDDDVGDDLLEENCDAGGDESKYYISGCPLDCRYCLTCQLNDSLT